MSEIQQKNEQFYEQIMMQNCAFAEMNTIDSSMEKRPRKFIYWI